MNRNSNVYTIVYAAVMVIIVAFLLAFVSSSLRERQDKNVELDKKKQILTSLNISKEELEDVELAYDKYVQADQIINEKGDVVRSNGGFKIESKEIDKELPLYVCRVNNVTKYVVPLYGKGLWGPIWGYISFNEDKTTVFGTSFSHESETAGLGGEIVNPIFRNQFKGLDKNGNSVGKDGKDLQPKKIQENGVVKITVVKSGQSKNEYEVDGISGGTITSKGVDAMLHDCLGKYEGFFKK